MKRGQPKRDWKKARAKVDDEGACRVCGIERGLQAAHIVPRQYDERRGSVRFVDPNNILPLCPPCHASFDAHELDVLPVLEREEELHAVGVLGLEGARRRVAPSDYRRNIVAAREEAELAA